MSAEIDPRELHRLFSAKADGTLTEAEHTSLCALLHSSAAARASWFAFGDAESALLAWAQREAATRSLTPARPAAGDSLSADRPPQHRARAYFSILAAGLVLGLAALGLFSQRGRNLLTPSPDSRAESTTPSVALLSRGVNMRWKEGGATPSPNSPLAPGVLRLESGVAEIEFFQGARLCMEGPAEIQLISTGEAFCRSGRFRAHVPPQARGFTLRTPSGHIVDLGTDFGLDLNAASPEVHVFQGEVELHRPKTQMQTITSGIAAHLDRSGIHARLAANADAFGFSDLDAGVNASQRLSFEKWQGAAAEDVQSEDLRLRLDFQEGPGARTLRNSAAHGQDTLAASIVGCAWTEGRWPGKHALQFRSLSDRVRLRVPGEYAQFSASCWVQLHGLNIKQSSLCMSEGIDPGSVHWQVLHDGSLCLGVGHGVKPNQSAWEDFISPVVFTPERYGQWVHIAVVYDAAAGEVRQYVDGSRVSRHPIKMARTLTPGLLELGNWNSPPRPEYRKQPVRNFIGCMDEFSIYSKALKDSDIERLAK